MLTHANLAANAHAISREHRLGRDDRVAAVLPLYHINAFAVTMLAPLAHGGSLAMAPRFSAARFWPRVAANRCTWINVVPTIISYLLEGEAPPREQLSGIRFCRSASAALPPEHHRAFEAKFGIGIIETMGLTETVAPAFSNPIEAAARRVGSVGRPSGCEARIVDENGKPLPDGETGEILIRGPQVTCGYYHNPDATRSASSTAGCARRPRPARDADGFFCDRTDQAKLIIKGGENIAPREIDEVLLRHPAVADAAAVGVPDRHYGQEILACVIVREDRRTAARRLRIAARGIARILRDAPGALQDAQGDPLRRRTSTGPFRQGPASEAARGVRTGPPDGPANRLSLKLCFGSGRSHEQVHDDEGRSPLRRLRPRRDRVFPRYHRWMDAASLLSS